MDGTRKETAMNPNRLIVTALAVATATATATAQQDMSRVEVKAQRVAGNVYMLTGRGGNIGLSVGDDGAFLIDDQFGVLSARILKTVSELTPDPIRFVVNTHWHGDHTGGNQKMAEAGAILVAHENVRRAMSIDHFMAAFDRTVAASPEAALPVVTFSESMTFHFNGDEIRVQHVAPAHTDGDAIVIFRDANVIHMGDTYFNGIYPFIDVSTGGSIAGMIAAADTALDLADDETQFIPGHGPLSGVAELKASRAMLQAVYKRVAELISQGRSRDEVIAAAPTREYDEAWGNGFLDPPTWVGIVYDSMIE